MSLPQELTSSTPTAQLLTTDRLCAARCLWSTINSSSPRRSESDVLKHRYDVRVPIWSLVFQRLKMYREMFVFLGFRCLFCSLLFSFLPSFFLSCFFSYLLQYIHLKINSRVWDFHKKIQTHPITQNVIEKLISFSNSFTNWNTDYTLFSYRLMFSSSNLWFSVSSQ